MGLHGFEGEGSYIILAIRLYSFNVILKCIHLDSQGQVQQLAFVQYAFDRYEHPIDIRPHGNSKGNKPFSQSKFSTISMLKKSVKTKQPLKALREVENVRGGVTSAKSGCDLPRDRKQVHNLKYASKSPPCSSASIPPTDVVAQVMQMCKDSSGCDAYVRSVEAAPEPMCIVSTDQQLFDIERFCTGESASVLSVGTTFNLGPFYVTPTTYQNLLVKTDRGNHPIVLEPVLIHHTKTFGLFHYLASTMIRLNPGLVQLRAFGTDGEPELIKAFRTCFPHAVHLRCMNHLRQNIKDKLHDLKFLSDIFGVQVGNHFECGLVDPQSDTIFSAQLKSLKERWNNLERSCKASS